MQLLAAAHSRGDSATWPGVGALATAAPEVIHPPVSSLVLDDTRQYDPTRDGRLSQFSGTVHHGAAPNGRPCQTTQIYEGTNQIQRMVIAKKLLS
jgi:hypothetical protein